VEYEKALRKLPARYEECPLYCQHADKVFDVERINLCESCPRERQRRTFERETEVQIDERLGEGEFESVDLKRVVAVIRTAAAIQDLPPNKMTVYASYIVSAYLKEKHRD
jgi:hypothetical protein